MEIRKAELTDLDFIYEECINFSKFYDSKKSLMGSPDHAKTVIANLIENHVVFVAVEGDIRLGFIAGICQPHHFNPDIKLLAELLWWVREEYRGSKAGSLLLDEFVCYGEEHCDWINFTLEANSPVNDVCLKKRGFRLIERAYLSEVR